MSVVVDPEFGALPKPLGEAFWLIESPANRALADRLFSAGGHDPNSAVFRADPSASSIETALGIWDTVVLHHPQWTEIEFIGAALEPKAREAFIQEGLRATPTQVGFTVSEAHDAPST